MIGECWRIRPRQGEKGALATGRTILPPPGGRKPLKPQKTAGNGWEAVSRRGRVRPRAVRRAGGLTSPAKAVIRAAEISLPQTASTMLQINDLTFRIDGRPLFEGASAQIADGWKVGLVGRNGTGKSTLLRIIREEIGKANSPIRIRRGARMGFVAQEVAPTDD